jgi:hypothetical protein
MIRLKQYGQLDRLLYSELIIMRRPLDLAAQVIVQNNSIGLNCHPMTEKP